MTRYIQTLPADMFPSSMVGSVAGLMGGVGSFGGVLFNLLIGEILTRTGSYAPVFVVAGLLHPVSFVLVLALIRRIGPVDYGNRTRGEREKANLLPA